MSILPDTSEEIGSTSLPFASINGSIMSFFLTGILCFLINFSFMKLCVAPQSIIAFTLVTIPSMISSHLILIWEVYLFKELILHREEGISKGNWLVTFGLSLLLLNFPQNI